MVHCVREQHPPAGDAASFPTLTSGCAVDMYLTLQKPYSYRAKAVVSETVKDVSKVTYNLASRVTDSLDKL